MTVTTMPCAGISIVLTGDLVLDEPDAGHWLSGIAPALREADLAVGHLEVPHTASTYVLKGDVPAPGAPPENLPAIAEAGIAMVSLAGNHISDCGPEGIADTIAGLEASGIRYAGAGANLAAARVPAFAQVGGKCIALLSYNCVGPEAAWATVDGAGCAYLPVIAADGAPVSPQADLQKLAAEAIEILCEDVTKARAEADLVLVAMHKGVVHTPAMLAPYERDVARAAIDAGADAVFGHHAHIGRGIEFYRDRPIFHGLGNGCVITRALSPDQDDPARREWAERRKQLFGFEPDPRYTLAPFHPEARNAFLGKILLGEDGSLHAGVIPVDVEPPGRPVIAGALRAEEISRYLEAITVAAGLPAIHIDRLGFVEEAA